MPKDKVILEFETNYTPVFDYQGDGTIAKNIESIVRTIGKQLTGNGFSLTIKEVRIIKGDK